MKKLSVKQMYYILWVTIMNQSQNALTVMHNAEELLNRLEKNQFYGEMGYEQINHCFNTLPKLHRFPNKMARNIYNSIITIKCVFDGDVSKVFSGDEKNIIMNLLKFDGISYHKANLCTYILKCIQNRELCSGEIRKKCNCNITDEILFKELTIIENLL